MKKTQIAAVTLSSLLLVVILSWQLYVRDLYHADEAALTALCGSEHVSVQTHDNLVIFAPEHPTAGFLFYPGAKVEHTAYAPLLLSLAERNILCILFEMPCNLAFMDKDAAEGIAEQFPQIESWYIGGHSLGGAMAAGYAANHTEALDGLILLASYSTADLTDSGLRVLSVYGTEDGVLNPESYAKYSGNLPTDTTEHRISGGNHANFGNYGTQKGDLPAAVSPEEQVLDTADTIVQWMNPSV